jgi:hypothetical protein
VKGRSNIILFTFRFTVPLAKGRQIRPIGHSSERRNPEKGKNRNTGCHANCNSSEVIPVEELIYWIFPNEGFPEEPLFVVL